MRAVTHAALAALAVAAAVFDISPVLPVAAQTAARAAASRPAARTRLDTLTSLDDLKAAFNADRGRIRIVLLLSPT